MRYHPFGFQNKNKALFLAVITKLYPVTIINYDNKLLLVTGKPEKVKRQKKLVKKGIKERHLSD